MGSERGRLSRAATAARDIGDAVMIRHSLFSLPFALCAALLETGGRPPPAKLVWIVLAATGARNAANAFNRIADRRIDAANPRTAGRHLPSGRLSAKALGLFAAAMTALLILSAAMLNPLCVALLPLAGILVFGYSYAKRFTWLSHFWLGIACSAATMGAFLGISGRFELRYFVLAGAVALWVAGFDILYAMQDIEVDRAQGLKSLPARFGPLPARLASAASQALAVAALAGAAFLWPLGPAWLAGAGAMAALLIAEQLIALRGGERRIRIAAYTINEIIPLVVLGALAIDLYLL